MASLYAVYRATFARQDREAAQARAYERKHGFVLKNAANRIAYLRGVYAGYLPQLDDPHPLTRNHAGREMVKILREVKKKEWMLRNLDKFGNRKDSPR